MYQGGEVGNNKQRVTALRVQDTQWLRIKLLTRELNSDSTQEKGRPGSKKVPRDMPTEFTVKHKDKETREM